jgi:tetratricopeptide (TPR) repeat protein
VRQIHDLLRQAREFQRRYDFAAMTEHVEHALQLQSRSLDVLFLWAETLICTGRIAEARAQLGEIEGLVGSDAEAWIQLLLFYTQLGRHHAAYDCAKRLTALLPRSPRALFSVASAATIVGRIDEAEALLDNIISTDPKAAEAYYMRATLRRQSQEENHVEELKQRLSKTPANAPTEVPLSYALGKEYEDLGDYEESFACFARGAAAQKARLSYDVSTDEAGIAEVINKFDEAWRDRSPTGPTIDGPIFVLGLPRSGTTLVDRILNAHSEVTSLGEVNNFSYAVMRAGGPASGLSELMEQVADADLTALGEGYWEAMQGYGEAAPCLIDKTPANYLYLGLIMQSLPAARIVHMRRHPMASGYAMFKALFRTAYPFSYDLEQIGRYYAAYHRLMEHWQRVWPGRILDVDYEALVDDQEAVSREIVRHCHLKWSDACLTYHENATPTATASAAQVREPIYRQARDLWRKIEHHLEPMARTLRAEGVIE